MAEQTYQFYNKRTKRWCKYKLYKDKDGKKKSKILNVHNKKNTPFKGVTKS